MDLYNFHSVGSEANGEHSVIEVQLSMRRTLAAIAPVVEQLMRVIRACQCVHRGDRTVETALQEALKIAVVAFDGETPGLTNDISVKCRCESEKEVLVMIDLAHGTSSRERESVIAPAIHLIKRCVDEVRFAPDGTSLHLRKRRASDGVRRTASF
jgi:hypothetical protein